MFTRFLALAISAPIKKKKSLTKLILHSKFRGGVWLHFPPPPPAPKTIPRKERAADLTEQLTMSTIFSTATNLHPMFSVVTKSLSTRNIFSHTYPETSYRTLHQIGSLSIPSWSLKSRSQHCVKSLLSEVYGQDKFPSVGARSTGPIAPSHLIEVVKTAAQTGAQVVMDAVNKPRNITYKGLTDLVTE
ncbi:hypothetical protein RIF29_15517 [Crotalaria pallida]|uniref:Uncharacterized protein n=1 Tax=Crotalaria pallida TaxID=3830 RepID=A0AAN9FEY8_CROPI